MGYRDSEFYGYNNGKLLWFANYGLDEILMDAIFSECGECAEIEEREHCNHCIAYKAELILERQVIDEGIKFMTKLAKGWKQANRSAA
ncbi:hypothetical protein ES703_82526 [subsurface metagenome]